MDWIIGLAVWLIFGLVIGTVAKMIMPGADGGSFGITALLGIVGAIIGGAIGRFLNIGGDLASFSLTSMGFWISVALAVVGAIIVLTLYRLATGRSIKGD